MKKFDSINVIPFIDIMLVLLAIVLTTATFVVNKQLDITLPVSSSNQAVDSVNKLEIAVDSEGLIYIDGVMTSLDNAELQLRTVTKDTPISLLIDEAAEFKSFISVVDLLKTLSLDKVSVITRTRS
jgi:biopolymer transport protein ExbD